MKKRYSLEIINALLVLLFVYASVSKLMDFRAFQAHLQVTPFIGSFAYILSSLLPAGELFIVILLLIPRTQLSGLWLSFVAMGLFTIYVALMLAIQHHLPCTCGGLIQKLSWPQHLILNIAFTVLSLAGIIINSQIGANNVNKQRYALSVNDI